MRILTPVVPTVTWAVLSVQAPGHATQAWSGSRQSAELCPIGRGVLWETAQVWEAS
ncbi:MAG TPA: hypothetical protein VKJ01_02390 [Candidatus Solibacter sp.]|nr:hypothetical protein [Candidatus Solibacter sp.]